MLCLRTFGDLSLARGGVLHTGQASQRRRLALLAAAGKRGLSRDKLLGYLWRESGLDAIAAADGSSDSAVVTIESPAQQSPELLGTGDNPTREATSTASAVCSTKCYSRSRPFGRSAHPARWRKVSRRRLTTCGEVPGAGSGGPPLLGSRGVRPIGGARHVLVDR
jgi:hypothetical protein